jgi:hypothetical protein
MENFGEWFLIEDAYLDTKDKILQHWQNLRDVPLLPNPVPTGFKGSTFTQDAIRITGSSYFIDSILTRLKDFLRYESMNLSLDVAFQEIKDKYERPTGRYVCYIKVKQRKPKKRKGEKWGQLA